LEQKVRLTMKKGKKGHLPHLLRDFFRRWRIFPKEGFEGFLKEGN